MGFLKWEVKIVFFFFLSVSLLGHYLRICYQTNLLRRFSHLLLQMTYTLVYIIAAKWHAYFLHPPTPHILHQKCLHIQFTDIPCFHALAPLQKYMYLLYLYPSVNCRNEFCSSTIKNCQKAKTFFFKLE